jgi:hypothetical protein
MITLTFDDAHTSVLRDAAPILRRCGMVATIGAICDRVFWNNTQQFMGPDELRELESEGWEIASHSLFHRRLSDLPACYRDEIAPWHQDPTSGAWVADCAWRDVGTVAYEGKFLRRATSREHFRTMSEGFLVEPERPRISVKLADDEFVPELARLGSAERELAESKRIFEENGFTPESFIVPFSDWPAHLQPIGAKYYRWIACGSQALFNTPETVSSRYLARFGVGRDVPLENVITRIEEHLSHGSWAIIVFHDLVPTMTGKWKWEIGSFERLVQWIGKENIPVSTLSAGAKRLAAEHLPASRIAKISDR